MSSKERLRISLAHKEPDRVPIDFGGLQSGIHVHAYKNLLDYLGKKSVIKILDINQQIVEIDEDILEKFNIDTRYIHFSEYNPNGIEIKKRKSDEFYTDVRGVVWRKPKGGYYFDLYDSPFKNANIEDLETYNWNKIFEPIKFDWLDKKMRSVRSQDTGFALVTNFQGIVEGAWELRGIENSLIDIVINRKFVEILFDNILKVKKEIYGRFLDVTGCCLDLVKISEDLGIQTGLLVSLDCYKEVIKPYQIELVNFIKTLTDAKVAIHTDGGVKPLISELIEVGFDVLNPVQVSAYGMDTSELKKNFGRRISFWGGIDTHKVLPFGKQEDVKEEVRRRISDLAPGGGYILASVHNIQPEVPPENIFTMFEAAKEYGSYPLQIKH